MQYAQKTNVMNACEALIAHLRSMCAVGHISFEALGLRVWCASN